MMDLSSNLLNAMTTQAKRLIVIDRINKTQFLVWRNH